MAAIRYFIPPSEDVETAYWLKSGDPDHRPVGAEEYEFWHEPDHRGYWGWAIFERPLSIADQERYRLEPK